MPCEEFVKINTPHKQGLNKLIPGQTGYPGDPVIKKRSLQEGESDGNSSARRGFCRRSMAGTVELPLFQAISRKSPGEGSRKRIFREKYILRVKYILRGNTTQGNTIWKVAPCPGMLSTSMLHP
jgi:hypothetical protein